MPKRKEKKPDPRLATPPGHYLKNVPWHEEFVEAPNAKMISTRDTIILGFLLFSSIAVAAALWLNPPHMLRFKQEQAIKGQATLAGNRIPRPYNGLGYDPQKFEELKDDDPMIQDDLEDVLVEDTVEVKPPAQSL